MYNRALNEAEIKNFAHQVRDKRIVLVGNSASLFSNARHGELIDSYDVVVRFGKGWPDPVYSNYLGTRTDVWFFGAGRAGMYEKFRDVEWKIYTPSQLKIYDSQDDDCLIPRCMLDGDLEIYRDFFMTGTANEVVELNRRVNGEQASVARLSQGIQAIDFFVNKVKPTDGIDLIGFDFFEQQFTYNFDNSRSSNIPRQHPTTSWHCPLVNKHYERNPHSYSLDGRLSNEKKYITSLPGVSVMPMPPVDLDRMESVLKRLRGKSSSIER